MYVDIDVDGVDELLSLSSTIDTTTTIITRVLPNWRVIGQLNGPKSQSIVFHFAYNAIANKDRDLFNITREDSQYQPGICDIFHAVYNTPIRRPRCVLSPNFGVSALRTSNWKESSGLAASA